MKVNWAIVFLQVPGNGSDVAENMEPNRLLITTGGTDMIHGASSACLLKALIRQARKINLAWSQVSSSWKCEVSFAK